MKVALTLICLLVPAGAAVFAAETEGTGGQLKVGFAQVDITPPVGAIMTGAHHAVSERTEDPLRARALVVQGGGRTLNGDKIQILESGGHASTDLFVRKDGRKIQVGSGQFGSFNSWKSAKKIGTVKPGRSSLAIIDAAGLVVPSQFPPPNQRWQPATTDDRGGG